MNPGKRLSQTTQKALAVKQFCQEFKKEHDYYPTIRNIMAALNISSTSVVRYYFDLLEKEGYLLPRPFHSSRLMQFTDKE